MGKAVEKCSQKEAGEGVKDSREMWNLFAFKLQTAFSPTHRNQRMAHMMCIAYHHHRTHTCASSRLHTYTFTQINVQVEYTLPTDEIPIDGFHRILKWNTAINFFLLTCWLIRPSEELFHFVSQSLSPSRRGEESDCTNIVLWNYRKRFKIWFIVWFFLFFIWLHSHHEICFVCCRSPNESDSNTEQIELKWFLFLL